MRYFRLGVSVDVQEAFLVHSTATHCPTAAE
jgi:hypothetical protein